MYDWKLPTQEVRDSQLVGGAGRVDNPPPGTLGLFERIARILGIQWKEPDVQMTIEAGQYAWQPLGRDVTVDIATGAQITMITVPQGERWRITDFVRATTVGSVRLNIVRVVNGQVVWWQFPATTGYAEHGMTTELEPGDIIEADDGNVADTAFRIGIQYLRRRG